MAEEESNILSSEECSSPAEVSSATSNMARGQEVLGMDTTADNQNQPGYKGVFLSYKLGAVIIASFICLLIIASLLVFSLAACPPPDDKAIRDALERHNYSWCNDSIDDPIESTLKEEDNNLRLPHHFIPVSYELKIMPFFNNFTFRGEVDIKVNCASETSKITLHSSGLEINNKTIIVTDVESGFIFDVPSVNIDYKKDFYNMSFIGKFKEERFYNIHMKFNGVLNDFLQGFYRSSYKVGNETRWLAVTQFQPTDARRAFPCFDEPALKARFKIHVGRPSNMSSISNMPKERKSEPVDGIKNYMWDHFQGTLPMSTYLVSFVISDFSNITIGNVGVWAHKEVLSSAEYALRIAGHLLSYFEDFFQIKYPLPKLDMIAVPDFAAGAMENWGLITYRETAMLFEQGVSSEGNKLRVANIVSHEVAHQWFGDLVTPEWWSDLWLNEGFATYMEYFGIRNIDDSWQAMDQFVLSEVQSVFCSDALDSTHIVSVEVKRPEEVNDIFDKISYGKGASMIRMMHHFLTDPVFKKGLTQYLSNKEYQSATRDDLWAVMTEVGRAENVLDNETNIKEIMDTWALQTGFPVVTVNRVYTSGGANFSQSRFFFNNSTTTFDGKPRNGTEKWWIPITYTIQPAPDFNVTRPSYWLKNNSDSLYIEIPNLKSHHWLIVNMQQTGFYRVNYDKKNWEIITAYLQKKNQYEKISPTNRAMLIDDAMNLAQASLLEYKTALDLTKYLEREVDYIPWKAAINSFGFIENMMSRGGYYHLFRKYMLKLIDKVHNEMGFSAKPKEDLLTKLLRSEIQTLACMFDETSCLSYAVGLFQDWMGNPGPDKSNPVETDMKSVLYCTAIRIGGTVEWDFLWERYLRADSGSERETILSALACSRETWVLARYLHRALYAHGIRRQDIYRVFGSVANTVTGAPLAFEFIRENWARLSEIVGPNPGNMLVLMKYATRRMNTQYDLKELMDFGESKNLTDHRLFHQAVEQVYVNVHWMSNHYESVVAWLRKPPLRSKGEYNNDLFKT